MFDVFRWRGSDGRGWILLFLLMAAGLWMTPPPAAADCPVADYPMDIGDANDSTSRIGGFYLAIAADPNNPNAPNAPRESYLISGQLNENGTTYRAVSPGGWLAVRMVLEFEAFDLDEHGVPYCDAILDVRYKDTINDARPSPNSDGVTTKCRPKVMTRLEYGTAAGDPWSFTWSTLGGLGGLNDNQWKTAHFFLEATPRQNLRAISNTFWFCIRNPVESNVDLPIDSITLRFVSHVTLVSLRDTDRHNRTLERVDFQDDHSLDPSNYGNDPFVIYTRNYLEKIYPKTVPHPEEIADHLSAFEIAGQREPVTFAIYAFDDPNNPGVSDCAVSVDSNGLVNGSNSIPANHVQINLVAAADKRWYWGLDEYYGAQPWYLDDNHAFDVPRGESRQVWVTIDVPSETPVGTYTGDLTLVWGSPQESRTLPLSITVYQLDLQPPDAQPNLIKSPWTLGSFYANSPDINVQDMKDHDVRPQVWVYSNIILDPNDHHIQGIEYRKLFRELHALSDAGILSSEPQIMLADNRKALWQAKSGNTNYFVGECEAFDIAYKQVLTQYRDVLNAYCCEPGDPNDPNNWRAHYPSLVSWDSPPVLTCGSTCSPLTPWVCFVDEPGADPAKRAEANRCNRLAKEVGLKTSVTYYTNCEKPLAGYHLGFDDLISDVAKSEPPESMTGDLDHCKAYWNFNNNDPNDASGHGCNGQLHGSASISNGTITFPNHNAYMSVPHSDWLNLTDQATIQFWWKPTARCPDNSWSPLMKDNQDSDPDNRACDYRFLFFGLPSGQDYADLFGFYGTTPNGSSSRLTWQVSGQARLDSADPMSVWYNVVWSYDASAGGTMYVNGTPFSGGLKGSLVTNTNDLMCGTFEGAMDDILLLDRKATDAELASIIRNLNSSNSYDKTQTVSISLSIDDPNSPPYLSFVIEDASPMPNDLEDPNDPNNLESLKSVTLQREGEDDVVLWSDTVIDHQYQLIQIPLEEYRSGGGTLQFSVTNRQSRHEEVNLYFIEEYWRAKMRAPADPNDATAWPITPSDHWTVTVDEDPTGVYGPMDLWLDERVYAMPDVSRGESERTRNSSEAYHSSTTQPAEEYSNEFSYYTTYPGSQDVPVNNRFLNGLYASAMGARSATIYAYGDWGSDPWDDCEGESSYKMSLDYGNRGYGGYQLILPSWNGRVYDTLIYESLREGIEDSRIIATLKKAIADHPNAPCAAGAQAALDDWFSRPAEAFAPRYWNVQGDVPIEDYGDRSGEILTDLAGYSRSFVVFDQIRLQMITYISALEDPDVDGDCIADAWEPDCNNNGSPDDYDIALGTSQDCNYNGIPDECDIATSISQDCNGNGVPDECEWHDCNGNGILDVCDILVADGGTCAEPRTPSCSHDTDGLGIPDECKHDCNNNSIPDICEIVGGCEVGNCATFYPNGCGLLPDCNQNGVPDWCDLRPRGYSWDTNHNGVPDECERRR